MFGGDGRDISLQLWSQLRNVASERCRCRRDADLRGLGSAIHLRSHKLPANTATVVPMKRPMAEAERRAALEQIIRESEIMRDLAARSGHDFLAFLLANVLEEARSTLAADEAEKEP